MTIDTKFHRGLHRIWIVICCSFSVVVFVLEGISHIGKVSLAFLALVSAALLYSAGVIAFYVLYKLIQWIVDGFK